MKVGDLVTLSSYGKKRLSIDWVNPEDVGIVCKIRSGWSGGEPYEYKVMWTKSKFTPRWDHILYIPRRSLKFVGRKNQ